MHYPGIRPFKIHLQTRRIPDNITLLSSFSSSPRNSVPFSLTQLHTHTYTKTHVHTHTHTYFLFLYFPLRSQKLNSMIFSGKEVEVGWAWSRHGLFSAAEEGDLPRQLNDSSGRDMFSSGCCSSPTDGDLSSRCFSLMVLAAESPESRCWQIWVLVTL